MDRNYGGMTCRECGGSLYFVYQSNAFGPDRNQHSMWRYRSLLPFSQNAEVVSLGEGMTPLQKARCPSSVGIYLKNETTNPTGSQKDRALSIGISKAKELGQKTVMLYSDGSTALSSAAYAARAGLKNITVIPKGAPVSRLVPIAIYGSCILEFDGTDAEALEWAHATSMEFGIFETSTYRRANPYESEGPKTIGFEIFEQLGSVPDWIVVPVGGGGTLSGIWRAFRELQRLGITSDLPRIVGVLPQGYSVLEQALISGIRSEDEFRALCLASGPPTIQVKISMTCPPDGLETVSAIRESNGVFVYASDSAALQAVKTLGKCEGIYAEPSAAVAWTGIEQLLRQGLARDGETVVGLVTGSGFRETGVLLESIEPARISVNRKTGAGTVQKILDG